ncbi:conserved hypothetical protein [Methylocella silvestris BL2]|uniref:Uncharacterized protein n=1 Tax=Methylocella silvestris (strain DSM 15510 / CIP 108128 / LMG 27833 / NCIMB 13906 / BL2) TaxID=395965 RepID=B8ESF7_METSB|nr:hypothetical protein [Methylocella silvestris]ACK49847.1 conserved hypothetical protein [Methylocella silvestris BL2]
MNGETALAWNGDWAWSMPLIVVTVIFHVIGLGYINAKILDRLGTRDRRHFLFAFALVMGATTLAATVLHGFEACIWAIAYRLLGALPDGRGAMLYSLSAMTTYGHANIFLADHWQLMGALEALNGMILFGLTTAFLYGMIQRLWPVEKRQWRGPPTPDAEMKIIAKRDKSDGNLV